MQGLPSPPALLAVPAVWGPCTEVLSYPRMKEGRRWAGRVLVSLLIPTFCLQGLPPVPFGSGLAPEGAPAAEGLPERFASPAERPTPS